MAVSFHFLKNVTLSRRRNLKDFIIKIAKIEGITLESLDIIFCTDNYLLKINKKFLKHDFYTDIITFDLSFQTDKVIGEIYISVDRVKQNAIVHTQAIQKELHRVIFHGVLHLCGYKDKTNPEKKQMTGLENKYLSLYFKE